MVTEKREITNESSGFPSGANSSDSAGRNTGAAYGCEIDQILGQSWAFQVGLGQILDTPATLSALTHLWTYNFAPDAGGFRTNPANPVKGGRNYAQVGESGLVMCTFPDPAHPTPSSGVVAGYFNECMSGFEHEVASHMIWAGRLQDGFAITRTIHDRYAAAKRNPYNEVECGDHYARAMASYGSFIAVCGYAYHGLNGHLAFSPKHNPDDFKAAFTAAEGWGSYQRLRQGTRITETVTLKQGSLRLRRFESSMPDGTLGVRAQATLNNNLTSAAHDPRGHLTDPGNDDTDHDGTEARLGTSPLNPGEWFHATISEDALGRTKLSWPSAIGTSFTIQCGTNLSGWDNITTGYPGQAGLTTFTDMVPLPGEPKVFYRVALDAP